MKRGPCKARRRKLHMPAKGAWINLRSPSTLDRVIEASPERLREAVLTILTVMNPVTLCSIPEKAQTNTRKGLQMRESKIQPDHQMSYPFRASKSKLPKSSWLQSTQSKLTKATAQSNKRQPAASRTKATKYQEQELKTPTTIWRLYNCRMKTEPCSRSFWCISKS